MGLNKHGWRILMILSASIISFTGLYILCWTLKLVYLLKNLQANAHLVSSFSPLIWHIEEIGYKIERAYVVYWMALGGAIVQLINGVWRWASKD